MKKKIAWITDSACSLPKDFIDQNDIYVLPLNLILGEEIYRENVDISHEEFYEKVKESPLSPTTSQPVLGEMYELFEKLQNEYEQGIAIHCSSKLSGTYQTSRTTAQSLGFNVHHIDSKIGSHPMGHLVKEGVRLAGEGMPAAEIADHIRSLTEKVRLMICPQNLEQLKKSGRVSSTKAFISHMLKINLVIGFQDGGLVVVDKIRTESRLKKFFIDAIQEAYKNSGIASVSILHAQSLKKALEWKTELESNFPDLDVEVTTLVPCAGIHTGYGTIGVSWVEK
ncbi:MAG: DegV family protein [Bacillus sp. (in: firmicutes)]